ncbi:unnamed protein product [Prunus armeniaca]
MAMTSNWVLGLQWVDRWLPTSPNACPRPPSTETFDRNLRVEAIINKELNEWNLDLIRHAIYASDARAITKIKFGSSRLLDRLIWAMERNGSYFVLSGYHWLHNTELRRRSLRPSSSINGV